MFNKKKIKELVLSSLVADAYCLGAHWVYDEKQLENLNINWNELNDAQSIWHKGKVAGEFTHYGDQLVWLYEFIQTHDNFNVQEYIKYWKSKMDSYNGYIDSASRKTIENIENNILPTGSDSTDLSIVGRISALLLVSKSKEDFLEKVKEFVEATHNSLDAKNTSQFFAKLLLDVLDGKNIEESILILKNQSDTKIQSYIKSGIDSKDKDSFSTIRDFGPACDINGGFQGVIHLLLKYDNFKDMLINNAKAGGDSSARAMISATIFMAKKNSTLTMIPQSWLNIKSKIL